MSEIHDVKSVFERQRAYVTGREPPTLSMRQDHLRRLGDAIELRESALLDALRQDLGKCATEAYTSEVGFVLRDIRHALKHVKRWMKPRRTGTPLLIKPARAYVKPEPLGVVLIVGPWNYPLQLLFSPMVGALSAGNAVCLKPSEFAPATANALHDLIAATFDPDHVAVVRGDHQVSKTLTSLPFDHIFFTGSTATGQMVAQAAAERLVPVTLELGGKSPCVVCADAPLKLAARRIMWGKQLNAGQTCVAPDFVLAHESIAADLMNELKQAALEFVPPAQAESDLSGYGRIVNLRHFERLMHLMEQAKVFAGGESDVQRLTIRPAVLTDVDWNHPLMREEIFGPLLPVLTFRSFDETIAKLNEMPKPLAAYLFTKDRRLMNQFESCVAAGGICINDTVIQASPADLPFGGVGPSGHGRYRGKAGFDCFSNLKAVVRRGYFFDLPFRFPPYKTSLSILRRAYRWFAG